MYTIPYALYSGGFTTTPVTSSTVDLLGVYSEHILEVAVTATSGGNAHITLQGSLDGTNWYDLISDTDLGQGGIVDLFGSSNIARYVRFTGHVTTGTATVAATATSGVA